MAERFENIKDSWQKLRCKLTQRNIIIFSIIFFAFWISVCDPNSLYSRYQMKKDQKSLLQKKKELQENIKHTNEELNALDESEYIERIAREKYLMKKNNEDIFIVTE